MARLARFSGALVAVIATVALSAPPATADAGLFVASGTISPGMGPVPQPVTGHVGGTFSGAVGGVVPAVCDADFDFASAPGPWPGDSFAAGLGKATGWCTGTTTSMYCELTYARVGVVVFADGYCDFVVPASSVLLFVSTSAPGAPIDTFNLYGAAVTVR